jgi:hypothetical protein
VKAERWELEVGSWKMEVGSWKAESGFWIEDLQLAGFDLKLNQ